MTKVKVACFAPLVSRDIDGRRPKYKLTDEQVAEIRALCERGRISQLEIARRYGVGEGTIYRIHNGRSRTVPRPTRKPREPYRPSTRPRRNLTDDQIAEILRLRPNMTQAQLAKMFAVSRRTIQNVEADARGSAFFKDPDLGKVRLSRTEDGYRLSVGGKVQWTSEGMAR